MNDKPLTGVRKRQQIETTNKQIMIWVSVASCLVVVGVVFAINFLQDITYQIKVNGALSQTSATLSKSVDNIPNLVKSANNLSTDRSLSLQNLNSYIDNNGNMQNIPAQQVVLYALPTTNDAVSLGVALQNILAATGASITQLNVGSNGASGSSSGATATATASATTTASTTATGGGAVAAASNTDAQPVQFSITVGGSPDSGSVQRVLRTLERTTRIVTVNSVTATSAQTTIQATTYYAPLVDYKVGTQEVKP